MKSKDEIRKYLNTIVSKDIYCEYIGFSNALEYVLSENMTEKGLIEKITSVIDETIDFYKRVNMGELEEVPSDVVERNSMFLHGLNWCLKS